MDIEGDSLDVDILTADPSEMGIGDEGQTAGASDLPEGENPDEAE